jgi:hypothetical protein
LRTPDDPWSDKREVLKQSTIASPVITLTLAAPIQPLQMQPLHLLKELIQARIVAAHSVVIVIPTKLGIQQFEIDFPTGVFPEPSAP